MNALLKLVSNYFHPDEAVEEQVFRIGEFKADYSPLSAEELAQDDPEMIELLKRSRPASR